MKRMETRLMHLLHHLLGKMDYLPRYVRKMVKEKGTINIESRYLFFTI